MAESFVRPFKLITAHQRLTCARIQVLMTHVDYDCLQLIIDKVNDSVQRELHTPRSELCARFYQWLQESLVQRGVDA